MQVSYNFFRDWHAAGTMEAAQEHQQQQVSYPQEACVRLPGANVLAPRATTCTRRSSWYQETLPEETLQQEAMGM